MTTNMFARFACAVGIAIAFAGSALAADTGAVIALPDAPFVIPCVFTATGPNNTPTAGQSNVTTQLYNNARQGANLAETALNPCNVQWPTFGKLTQGQVKGQVLAQPLYVRDVDVDGFGRRNLLVVATAANIVYAFDVNDLRKPLFKKYLVDVPTPQNPDPDPKPVDPSKNNSLVPVCAETYPPYIGVSSTPVIDAATGTVFVVAFDSTKHQHVLHALNLHHQFASDRPPAIILPPGEPSDLWSQRHRNRPGLLLSKGIVYVAFGSFICDSPWPYAGWVLGYRATDLTQVAHWETPNPVGETSNRNSPPSSGSSGIWQSGRGLVASDDGDIYFMTGNDNNFSDLKDHTSDKWFSGGGGTDHDCFKDSNLHCSTDSRLANSFVKLRPTSGPNGLDVVGSFSPTNSSQLSAGDTDLGSSGPILLPGDRLVGGGKQGRIYVIDPSTMQSLQDHTGDDGFQGFQAFFNNYHTTHSTDEQPEACTNRYDHSNSKNSDHYCRQLQTKDLVAMCDAPRNCYIPTSCYQYCQGYGPNIHAGFVYWQPDPNWGLLYAMPEKEHVKAFKYDVHKKEIEETPVAASQLIVPDGMPGGALSISANGGQDGIVWVSMPNREDATTGVHRGSLVALGATDLHELWKDECIWYFAKFNPPTVADGHVFLATFADPVSVPNNSLVPDPDNAPKPGKDCDLLPDLDVPLTRSDLFTSVGTAWIIEYGLK
jgi:hypothetical protein